MFFVCNIFKKIRLIGFLIQWLIILCFLIIAYYIQSPFLLKVRGLAYLGVPLLSAIFIFYFIKRANTLKNIRLFFSLAATVSVILMLVANKAIFLFKYTAVLNTESQPLQELGRHFIVGYQQLEDILPLVKKGAIGGVFITQRNAVGRTKADLINEIKILQTTRQQLKLPPLWIATDQEGGAVSRLSPPLTALPPLASLANPDTPPTEIRQYGRLQGKELAELGVNVNLSPVVDLKFEQVAHRIDFHTLIIQRAIASDKQTVAQVALAYSQGLIQQGVIPTVKHFPGLGRVTEDTHYTNAALAVDVPTLKENDWFPFKHVIRNTPAFMMLSHVKLPALDPDKPVSYSYRVVQGLIREQWQHEGVLITDDFNMWPVFHGKQGIGTATVLALNAGVDLILISYDGDQYYSAMYAALQAYAQNRIKRLQLKKSKQRLMQALSQLQ